MADSMTDRLRLLLTMSTHTYLIQPLLMLWALQRNKCRPRIVAAQKRAVKKKVVAAASDQINTVGCVPMRLLDQTVMPSLGSTHVLYDVII